MCKIKNIINVINEDVAVMKSVQRKPTKIYLSVLIHLFAIFMFSYGYMTAKFTADNEKEEEKDK